MRQCVIDVWWLARLRLSCSRTRQISDKDSVLDQQAAEHDVYKRQLRSLGLITQIVPGVFTQTVPATCTQNVPALFTQNVPAMCGQDVPPWKPPAGWHDSWKSSTL